MTKFKGWNESYSELITMSTEAHQEEMRRVTPGLLKTIKDAADAGRPMKISTKRATIVVNKDDRMKDVPEDGRNHVLQSGIIEIHFVIDTGKPVVSE